MGQGGWRVCVCGGNDTFGILKKSNRFPFRPFINSVPRTSGIFDPTGWILTPHLSFANAFFPLFSTVFHTHPLFSFSTFFLQFPSFSVSTHCTPSLFPLFPLVFSFFPLFFFFLHFVPFFLSFFHPTHLISSFFPTFSLRKSE